MSGIVFMKTKQLDDLREFYSGTIGCELWLDQGGCVIFQHGNLLTGFCSSETAETTGVITFFYPSAQDVDAMHDRLINLADAPPRKNDRYHIYQFFARDPENRILEFQYFLHPVARYLTGAELLMHRRSIREFLPDQVPEPLLIKLLEMCRYSPTSMNSQSYYFKLVTDPDDLAFLAATRGAPSAPIGRAPMAVAIVADPAITKRPDQDADIAACHFIMAAHYMGLGTCWIAAMNRDDVKERLKLPTDIYIATVTPLGFPKTVMPCCPKRRKAEDLLWNPTTKR